MKSEYFYGAFMVVVLALAILGLWHVIEQAIGIVRVMRRTRFIKKKLDSLYRGEEILERYRDYKPCGMTITFCENGCCPFPTPIFEETVKVKDPKGNIRTARRIIAANNPEFDGPKPRPTG